MVLAFVVTLLAGLATSVGGALALVPRWRAQRKQATALALAAGAMIAVSAGEMLPHAFAELAGPHQWRNTALAFAAGLIVAALLGWSIPRLHRRFRTRLTPGRHSALARTAIVAGAVMIAHNLPEGMATFQATLHDPQFGVGLAVAIALHNLPEGMAVAAPLYLATGRLRPGLLWATLSGLAEPIGGLLGHLVFAGTVSTGGLLAALAAMMLAISVGELLPAAWKLAGRRRCVIGTVTGAAVMLGTLAVL